MDHKDELHRKMGAKALGKLRQCRADAGVWRRAGISTAITLLCLIFFGMVMSDKVPREYTMVAYLGFIVAAICLIAGWTWVLDAYRQAFVDFKTRYPHLVRFTKSAG